MQESASSSTATQLEPIAPKIAKLLLFGAYCCCSPLHGLLATAAAARSRAADPSQQKQRRRSSNPRDSSRVPLGVGCPIERGEKANGPFQIASCLSKIAHGNISPQDSFKRSLHAEGFQWLEQDTIGKRNRDRAGKVGMEEG